MIFLFVLGGGESCLSEEVEFEIIEAKPVGNTTVAFKLSDGTMIFVDVEITRAGKRIKENGEAEYNFGFGQRVRVKSTQKTFKVKRPKRFAKSSGEESKSYMV